MKLDINLELSQAIEVVSRYKKIRKLAGTVKLDINLDKSGSIEAASRYRDQDISGNNEVGYQPGEVEGNIGGE